MKRFTLWLYLLLSLSMLPAVFGYIFNYDGASLGMSILAIFLMSFPFFIEKRFGLKFPRYFISTLFLFLYASVFLGSANHFYVRFWWWDKMLHGFSGIIFAHLGLLIAIHLHHEEKMDSEICRILLTLFSFSFAVASGAIWEIYEYLMDQIFGSLYQGVGINDTMIDIIFDTVGALIFALFFFIQRRKFASIIEIQIKNEHPTK